MEVNQVDPYAPPKSALTGTDNTTFLDQDGYAYNTELVANEHFKSPLICAKLGTPIPPESNPEPQLITVKRVSIIASFTIQLISILIPMLLFLSVFYFETDYFLPAFGIYIILSIIMRYFTTKPYKIPFYFSERYTRIHRNRRITFGIIFTTLAIVIIYGIITGKPEVIAFATFTSLITAGIYQFMNTKFVVTRTKGEFHYIRGTHRNLRESLPHLPISS